MSDTPRSGGTLVLLTAAYPFGTTSEPFLDAEVPILARRFSRVILIPSRREPHARPLPGGAECATFLADAGATRLRRALGRHTWPMLAGFARALAQEGRARCYLRHPRTYLYVLSQNLAKARALQAFVAAEDLREAVFYDYWLENSTLALACLRREGVIRRAVARAHRFDLYDESWPTGAVPFLARKVVSLDRVIAISEHGLRYLRRRLPAAADKVVLSRLGVAVPARPKVLATRAQPGALPLLVSCAQLLPRKRVEMIPDVLRALGRPVRWVHFGDGPERAKVERAAAALPASIEWRLAGHLAHPDLLRFYATHRVDVFLSMSAMEGLPVSIMEAISHGIPVVAAGVCGVPEIVNEHTGVLVDAHDPPCRVAAAVRLLLDGGGPATDGIMRFCWEHFSAERNFNQLADLLQTL